MKLTKTIMFLAFGLAIAADASALEPAKSSMVTKVTGAAPSNYRIDDDVVYLGIQQCRNSLGVSTNVSGTFEMSLDPNEETGGIKRFDSAYYFSVARNTTSSPTCPDNCVLVDEDENTTTGEDPYFIRAWVTFEDLMGISDPDECEGFDNEYFVRVHLQRNLINDETAEEADAKFVIDTIRPTPPPNYEVTVTQNQVSVTWELAADDDIEKYGIYWSTNEFQAGELPADALSSKFFTSEGGRTSGSAEATFEPGSTVYVGMVSSDETGNGSVMGEVIATTVIETLDFWGSYQAAGGAEQGGCSVAPGQQSTTPFLMLFAFVSLGLWRRR